MSIIITLISLFVLSLTAIILIKHIQTRKIDKLISNHYLTIQECRAARRQSLNGVRAQVDELKKSADNLNKNAEALGNFYKSEFWNEKNIH